MGAEGARTQRLSRTRTRARTRTRTHAHARPRTHAPSHAHARAHTHTHTHTYTHTHTHAHTHRAGPVIGSHVTEQTRSLPQQAATSRNKPQQAATSATNRNKPQQAATRRAAARPEARRDAPRLAVRLATSPGPPASGRPGLPVRLTGYRDDSRLAPADSSVCSSQTQTRGPGSAIRRLLGHRDASPRAAAASHRQGVVAVSLG